MALTILTAALALAATIIAILSMKTFDWDRKRPTPGGWVALGVAATAFILAAYQAYSNHKKESAVARLAATQMWNTIAKMSLPFAAAIKTVNGDGPPLPSRPDDLLKWRNPKLRENIARLQDFSEQGKHVLPGPAQPGWEWLFCTFTGGGQEELKARIAPFYGVLSGDLITKANDIIDDRGAANLRSLVPCGRTQESNALVGLLNQPATLAYIDKLIALQDEITMLGGHTGVPHRGASAPASGTSR